MIDKQLLSDRVALACDWLCDVAQLKEDRFPDDTIDSRQSPQLTWKGAIRGEYSAAKKQWDFFCPIWHTGQAVKALFMAGKRLGNAKYLAAAHLAADFIYANQIWEFAHPDHGLILAYEDYPDKVNTSAILEGMHGLMLLADDDGAEDRWQRLEAAGEFVVDRLYMPGQGLFRDVYCPGDHSVLLPNPYRTKNNLGGRPLLDDAVFLHLFRHTGERQFLDTHIEIAQRLLDDQNPRGNWIDYGPCQADSGLFHPRHTFWWGTPLVETWRETKRQDFLATAIDSGKFVTAALRQDGGYFRGYYLDGKTDSFGHATSGSACAAILLLELFAATGQEHWRQTAELALEFCMKVQFTNAADANLQGAILEKVLPPDGYDGSPYHLRDLGTIFFIQAGMRYLEAIET